MEIEHKPDNKQDYDYLLIYFLLSCSTKCTNDVNSCLLLLQGIVLFCNVKIISNRFALVTAKLLYDFNLHLRHGV